MMGMWVQFNSVLNSGLVKLPQGQPSTSGSFGQDKARHGLPLLLCVQQLHSASSSVEPLSMGAAYVSGNANPETVGHSGKTGGWSSRLRSPDSSPCIVCMSFYCYSRQHRQQKEPLLSK